MQAVTTRANNGKVSNFFKNFVVRFVFRNLSAAFIGRKAY
jgi:hypothetical protein